MKRILKEGDDWGIELPSTSIGGTILCLLVNFLLRRTLRFLTAGRDGLEDLLYTGGSSVEEWLDLLLDRVLDLASLLVEGDVRGEDAAEFVDRSRQAVRNVLEAALNLRRELIGTGLNPLEFGNHGVTESVDLGLGEGVGGGCAFDNLLGSGRGPIPGRVGVNRWQTEIRGVT